MNILITGGAGNLGSRLVVPLARRGDKVVLFDIHNKPLVESKEFRQATFVEGDLADWHSVSEAVRAEKVESIFHLGAILSSEAEERPEVAWRVNMDGTRNVLESARTHGVRRVVFSSTVATYGPGLPEPLSLDAPQWPMSLYGSTKVASERLGVYYHSRFGLDFRAIRFPAVAAPRGASGGASAFCSAVFEELVLHGRYDFYLRPTTRCPILYIADAVSALLMIHDAPEDKLRRRVYNIGALGPSAEELAENVRRRLPDLEITYHPDPGRTAIVEGWPSQIDDRHAQEDWGWKATYDLTQMVDEIVETLQHEFQEK